MLGALAGDIVGSIYEWNNIKTTSFPLFQDHCRFTDDTVLTVALADAIMGGEPYAQVMRRYYRSYPDAGYGKNFALWAASEDAAPYQSWGNGSAMRIAPAAWAFDSLDDVLQKAEEYTLPTHGHPEGVRGAQAAAAAIYLGRSGAGKEEIRSFVSGRFGYDLSRSCDEIRPGYRFDVSCQGTVPQALAAFFDSEDFESALRLAVSLGGDSDTLACIAGGVAQAFYGGVPFPIAQRALRFLDEPLRRVTLEFEARFVAGRCFRR
ncbi:ADP-ribosylglycohydrolase family protein [Geomonas sp. Red69]|uniref:ADP-ribosylglycohydrolase family protein n=1 Tax=Geomonas diazotrophica TaxID=2843197 RepID=UPI001C100F17|nr:ADP-ribosylglycohydrolase family protein [Geomonas diazotrophica]MBU5637615.1 ADP-ribosylglycohydrolase family protein [Geomonas diazotrophica]